jgi:ubiquinone/menaquinone biosynthesis C-methylase UbiE
MAILQKIYEWALGLSPTVKRLRSQHWYPLVTRMVKDTPVVFLNYGYVHLDPDAKAIELHEADEANRIFIHLYHRVAGAVDLRGRDVLEVSCGHGGGASYITRYLKPRSLLGVDLNTRAIEFCKRYHFHEGLRFSHGDAESLHFDDHSFDAIVNVEASHCYGHMERFLREVARVLRPGGHFLFADIRRKDESDRLHDQLVRSGLEVVEKENITPNILRAMEADSERRLRLIRQLAPKTLQYFFRQFAGTKGTGIYEAFHSGASVYLRYRLRKGRAEAGA